MSFGAVADDYDRLRPGPPDAAVDWLLPAGASCVVDLAAGTGLLTRALASRVSQVIAVEPDPRMAAVLRARSPGVQVLQGVAEAIPLPDASADAVLISSAWHWMDPALAGAEVVRVLRDGGRFGLIWASRDRQAAWWQELGQAAQPGRAGAGHGLVDTDDAVGPAPGTGSTGTGSTGTAPAPAAGTGSTGTEGAGTSGATLSGTGVRNRTGHREVVLPGTVPLRNVLTASFRFTRPMAISDIVGMLATYSGMITASPQDRAAGLARARAALEQRFPGAAEIEVPMRAWCWRADRVPRAASRSRGRLTWRSPAQRGTSVEGTAGQPTVATAVPYDHPAPAAAAGPVSPGPVQVTLPPRAAGGGTADC